MPGACAAFAHGALLRAGNAAGSVQPRRCASTAVLAKGKGWGSFVGLSRAWLARGDPSLGRRCTERAAQFKVVRACVAASRRATVGWAVAALRRPR
eukprot:gene19981-16578_t